MRLLVLLTTLVAPSLELSAAVFHLNIFYILGHDDHSFAVYLFLFHDNVYLPQIFIDKLAIRMFELFLF